MLVSASKALTVVPFYPFTLARMRLPIHLPVISGKICDNPISIMSGHSIFFAISMERDGRILYSRCNFSRSPVAIDCFDLVYPQEEKRAWDPVVTRMSLSLRPLER